jgi:hypothetical protein
VGPGPEQPAWRHKLRPATYDAINFNQNVLEVDTVQCTPGSMIDYAGFYLHYLTLVSCKAVPHE